MKRNIIFKICFLVFSLGADLTHAELQLSQESINIFKRSQAAASGMGSIKNTQTSSINCTLGLNLSESRNRIEGRIISSPREEFSPYDFEASNSFAFKKNECSKSIRKDKNGSSYLFTTCIKRKETFCSKFWNRETPRFIVETLTFRSDFTVNGDNFPLVDYNYVVQNGDPTQPNAQSVYKFNCFAPFYPTSALHKILNY